MTCSDYQTLIAKAGTISLEMKRIQAICTEVYKSFEDLNPPYMKDLFVPRQNDYILRGSQISLFLEYIQPRTDYEVFVTKEQDSGIEYQKILKMQIQYMISGP